MFPSKELRAREGQSKSSWAMATIPSSRGHKEAKGSTMRISIPSSCQSSSRTRPPCFCIHREQPVYWPACFVHLVCDSNHLKAKMCASRIHTSPAKHQLHHSQVLRTAAHASTKDSLTIFLPNLGQSCFPRQCRSGEEIFWFLSFSCQSFFTRAPPQLEQHSLHLVPPEKKFLKKTKI